MNTVPEKVEVYLKVENDLIDNINEFQTDSNGLFNVKRKLNSKPSIHHGDYIVEDVIAQNYYPVTRFIYIYDHDDKQFKQSYRNTIPNEKAMGIVTDRS